MKLEFSKSPITQSMELASYRGLHGFWPVEFSNGRLGASHHSKESVTFGLVLFSATIGTGDFVTLKIQANKHPPLAASPHQVGPPASSANSSTGQKPRTVLYYVTTLQNQSIGEEMCKEMEMQVSYRQHHSPDR